MLNPALQLTTTSVHLNFNLCMFHTCGQSLESCLTLCDLMGPGLPSSSVHGMFQLRILEWIVMTSSRRSYWPRDWTCASCISCITGGFFSCMLSSGISLSSACNFCLCTMICNVSLKWSKVKWKLLSGVWLFVTHGLYSPWNSPGQNTSAGSLSFLQGIFSTWGSSPGLPHCRQILYKVSHKGSPRILQWIAYPFSSGSFQYRNQTGVSYIAGGFFTNWAIREALICL